MKIVVIMALVKLKSLLLDLKKQDGYIDYYSKDFILDEFRGENE